MKKYLFFFFSLLILNSSSVAQEKTLYGTKFTEGNYLILEENYPQALKNFLEAYQIDSSNANINYKVGFCYLKTESFKDKAFSYLEKAVKNTTKNYDEDAKDEKIAPVNAYYYFGLALHLNYRFDEAIANYEKFKSYLIPGKHNDLIKDVERQIEVSNNAKILYAAPVNFVIKNLKDSINSPYPDYSAVISADEKTLILTSRRMGSTGGDITDDGQYYEDIYISYKKNDSTWTEAKSISPNINTDEHEASVGLIADGQTLLIYKNINGGDIYSSHLDGVNWTIPQPMEGDINSSHWESSACLSPDGNTLYFVSDRPGGLGGRDIWTCIKLPNGKWSKATNVGEPINTKYDEESPFIDPNSDILFFSSKGHKTMGGFDIFFSEKTEKGWTEPTNIGYPINTVDDDLYYVTSPDGKRGYFTSCLRAGGYGEKDIYMSYAPERKEQAIILVKGVVIPAPGDPMPSDIEIFALNNESGVNYSSKVLMRNGTFLFTLQPNAKYSFSYQQNGEEFKAEELGPYDPVYLEINKEIHLLPQVKGKPLVADDGKGNKGEKETDNNVVKVASSIEDKNRREQLEKVDKKKFEMYFKYNVTQIEADDVPFKKYVSNLMELYKMNGIININLFACASKVPTKKFGTNEALSKARADKAREQLIDALKEKGVDASKINFVKVTSIVDGPGYHGDYLTNKATYEKYQFVKVSAY